MNIIYILVLTFIWLVFSEKLTFEVFAFGFLISLFLTKFNKSLLNFNKPIIKLGYFLLFVKYIILLIMLIIKANIQVALIVLNPHPKLDSIIVDYETKLKLDFHKMLLANSITLTPGTLTISVENNNLKVHCLKSKFKDEVFNSKFEKILLEIEDRYYD